MGQNEDELEKLSRSCAGKIWRGSQVGPAVKPHQVINSGHKPLNRLLHAGGWPLSATTEFGIADTGIGELRLLIPALRELTGGGSEQKTASSQQNVVWVAPPFLPFAPALIKEGIDPNRLTIVQTNSIRDTLWATEQALQAECCAAVISWTGTYNLTTRELRRLQLAAEKTHTWNVLIRDSACLKQPSAAGLRIHLQSNAHSKLDLHIIKQPQGWGGQRCTLSLHPHYENWQRLPVSLLPHHNQTQTPILPEQLNDSSSSEHRQASVTLLGSVSALKVVN